MNYKIELILDYFTSRGWKIKSQGNLFVSLQPNENLNLPKDFELDIPKGSDISGFNNYISRLISDFVNIFPEIQDDELKILFSEKSSLIKYRIFDQDNIDGTITLNKFVNSIDTFKNVLEDAVNFTVNKKMIFGQTHTEAAEYFKSCRVMQSVKGSFVNRFEIQSKPLFTTFEQVTTDQINDKLFDVLNFVKEDVLVNINRPNLTENYITDNSEYINYELLKSIKTVYSKSYISNIEYTLEGNNTNRNVVTEKMSSKIVHFDNYLKNLKSTLENLSVFETYGYVTNLNSNNPINSHRNEVILDAKKAGLKKGVKFYLRSEEYLEALEAHKNHHLIKIKGKAKEFKTLITIQELENFEIIKQD